LHVHFPAPIDILIAKLEPLDEKMSRFSDLAGENQASNRGELIKKLQLRWICSVVFHEEQGMTWRTIAAACCR